jgi:hypothetical protein
VDRTLVLALFVSGCAVGHAQSGTASTRCRVDADCVIATSMPSCGPCGTCPGQPIALSAVWLAQRDRACVAQRRREAQRAPHAPATVAPSCGPCPAPPPSASHAWDAVCHERVCEAHERDAGPPPHPPRTIDDLLESPTS